MLATHCDEGAHVEGRVGKAVTDIIRKKVVYARVGVCRGRSWHKAKKSKPDEGFDQFPLLQDK